MSPLPLLIVCSLLVGRPEPEEPGPSSIEDHYEAWLLGHLKRDADNDDFLKKRYPATWERFGHLPENDNPSFFDPRRGLLVNNRSGPRALEWVHVGVETLPDPPHDNVDWFGMIVEMSEPPNLRPVECIPEACYFASSLVTPRKGRAELKRPGMWLALRTLPGESERRLAGILVYRTAPADPQNDPLLKRWLAALESKFPFPKRTD